MYHLKPIEHNGQRVLTTAQLAESFGTDVAIISNNFNRNKGRYVEGKHYFCLEGETLRVFKSTIHQNDESLLRVNKLYLWTEKGAWMHAKSLNTDQAWDAYEMLVDEYYRQKTVVNSLTQIPTELNLINNLLLASQGMLQQIINLDQKVQSVVTDIQDVKRGLVDINQPLRDQFNEAVRRYAQKAGIGYNEAYNRIYEMLGKHHHVDIKRRTENRQGRGEKVRPLDIVEELNLLVPAIRMAKVMGSVS